MVRSLLAAERSSWLVGLVVGEIADRLVMVWTVSWDVAVTDMHFSKVSFE